ncbi:MAG: hypothetical protein SFV15_23485 [Polyangiaceae bacterium]|nr:hypothetical protein [Polyangiaceae bacterium]
MKTFRIVLPGLIAGGIVAGVGVLLFRGSSADHAILPSSVADRPSGESSSSSLTRLAGRLSHLERRVEEGALRERSDAPETLEPGEQPRRTAHPPNPAEEREQVMLRLGERGRQFLGETYDNAWAPAAEDGIRRGLGKLEATAGFSLVELGCHSKLCQAKLRWPNFSQARDRSLPIIAEVYEPNCAVESYTIPPDAKEEPAKEYESTLIFDCS